MLEKAADLNRLKEYCALTPARCASFAEAACVCLENQRHSPGARLNMEGDFEGSLTLVWEPLDISAFDSWQDLEDAAEMGAYAVAIICTWEATPWQVIRQSVKTTGIDYWLGDKYDMLPFHQKARLEVSGIRRGSTGQVNYRLKEKLQQAEKSRHLQIPVVAVVVEFSRLLAKIAKQ